MSREYFLRKLLLNPVLLFACFLIATSFISQQNATLTITNNTGFTMLLVLFSEAGDDEWGPNRLDTDEVLENRSSRSWTVRPGTYDIRLVDGEGDTFTKAAVSVKDSVTVRFRIIDLDRE
jgi:hypothetical protein